jgi:phage tail-like protein
MEVDGLNLTFTKVEGLGAKYDMLTVKEGGENGFVHKLPGRLSYDDVKLTRPVDDKSGQLSEWFTSRRQGVNATISALDGKENVIASWTLANVFPHTYSGPSFKAGGSEVLIETLTLSHQGFFSEAAAEVGSGSGGGSALPAPTPSAAPSAGGGSTGGDLGAAQGTLGAVQDVANAAEDLSEAESPQDVVDGAGEIVDAAGDVPGTEETDEALEAADTAVETADEALDAADGLPGGEG